MRQRADQKNTARQQFSEKSRRLRQLRMLLLPMLAALLVPVAGFLYFGLAGPVAEAKPPLPALGQAPGLSLRVGGEILLAGKMAERLEAAGPEFPFRRLSEFLSAADFSYAFLEAPLADTGSPLPGKPLTLRAAPEAIESLSSSGLSLFGLASAHMMDYDAPALLQTTELIFGAGLGYLGAGENAALAAQPYTLSQKGLRLALLDFCENAEVFYSYQYPRQLAAGENEAGVANLDEEKVLEAIAEARRNHDLVILNLYWGEEFSYLPQTAQRELAHRLIDGGADIIVGRHSHCLQGAEIYHNGLIVYSLGNLVYAEQNTRQARESALLELELTPLGWQNARFYPLLLSAEGQPALATGQDANDILERLRSISAGFNAKFALEGSTLRLSK